jgi:hypothetical protein
MQIIEETEGKNRQGMWHWLKKFQIMKAINDIKDARDELFQACINGVLVLTVSRYQTGVSWLQGATQCHG